MLFKPVGDFSTEFSAEFGTLQQNSQPSFNWPQKNFKPSAISVPQVLKVPIGQRSD